MPIIVCGINHKTAPIALREQAVFAAEKIPLYLADLVNNEGIPEAVLLSTCNRAEIYCNADSKEKVVDWFSRQHAIPKAELLPALYCYQDLEAVQHMMSVACGLDSLVLGEPQILGQMKEAFSESAAAGSVGTLFHRLFQQLFLVAKEVRSTTAIGACPVSIASTTVNLLKQAFPADLTKARILLVGAGDTIELMLRYLTSHVLGQLSIVNRDETKSTALAEQFGATSYPFKKLPQLLNQVDIVVTATASAAPIMTQAMFASGKEAPLLMVDLAVPRDVEPAVGDLPGVRLYTIDDLKTIVQQHVHGREHAANKAREVIHEKSLAFITWLNSLDQVTSTIRAYRKQIEALSDEQLAKALRQLDQGEDPVRVLIAFAEALTNKLLHTPTVALRQAGVEGRMDLLTLAQQLFAIPEMS